MNIAGPIARAIFALTVVTVVGAVVSYALFKARDRKRRAQQAVRTEPELAFFVEYRLEPSVRGQPQRERWWPRVTARLMTALLLLGGAAAGVVFVLGNGNDRDRHGGKGAHAQQGARAIPNLGKLESRAPSLFPSAELDLNSDGLIDAKERALVHMIPQFVLITSDDNGSVEGLRWIEDQARARGIAAAVTYFDTANYLPERANYLGGPIDQLWQTQVAESYVGIHGTSHKSGGEHWTQEQWRGEQTTVLDEIGHRLAPPVGSAWERYPFGSRAPFLSTDDAYFSALEHMAPAIIYDSSMVATPQEADVDVAVEQRDLPWPFTLDHPLPPEVQILPDNTQPITSHHLWEVPLPAWKVPGAGKTTWITSLDLELFDRYPCDDAVDKPAVDAVLANLDAHYRGNRAPFHIGLHAQTYAAGSACQRATIAAILDGIDKRRADGMDIQPISIPDLLAWLDAKSQRHDRKSP